MSASVDGPVACLKGVSFCNMSVRPDTGLRRSVAFESTGTSRRNGWGHERDTTLATGRRHSSYLHSDTTRLGDPRSTIGATHQDHGIHERTTNDISSGFRLLRWVARTIENKHLEKAQQNFGRMTMGERQCRIRKRRTGQ